MRGVLVTFTRWEIDRVVEVMTQGPQDDVDRELMIKLWDAQRRIKARKLHNTKLRKDR